MVTSLVIGILRHRLQADGKGVTTHGGVTFGGGEPLLQVEFFKAFREICGRQWRLMAETSLNVPFGNVQILNAILDGYIVDVKDMSPEIYRSYAGKDNRLAV